MIFPIVATMLFSLIGNSVVAAENDRDPAEAESDIVVLSVAKRSEDSKPVLFSQKVAASPEASPERADPVRAPARVAAASPAPEHGPAANNAGPVPGIVQGADPGKGT